MSVVVIPCISRGLPTTSDSGAISLAVTDKWLGNPWMDVRGPHGRSEGGSESMVLALPAQARVMG